MLDEWEKYKKILEQEDKEFRKAMEKEVSHYLQSFSRKT